MIDTAATLAACQRTRDAILRERIAQLMAAASYDRTYTARSDASYIARTATQRREPGGVGAPPVFRLATTEAGAVCAVPPALSDRCHDCGYEIKGTVYGTLGLCEDCQNARAWRDR